MITKLEVQKQIQSQVQHYCQIAEQKGFSVPPPPINWNLRGSVAGYACSSWVKFNLDIASNHLSVFLVDTVPHELAHYYQRRFHPHSKPHGREWKKFCQVLTGKELPRCHTFSYTPARKSTKIFEFRCGCEFPHKVSRIIATKISLGKTYRCRRCKQKLVK